MSVAIADRLTTDELAAELDSMPAETRSAFGALIACALLPNTTPADLYALAAELNLYTPDPAPVDEPVSAETLAELRPLVDSMQALADGLYTDLQAYADRLAELKRTIMQARALLTAD